eukprot:gnl/TRDRNA2_/TRDRNA2_198414_c0_seq1.p1 gnl/TRDRNA2_/TRDRNA2_198414_c0~~gnl/TRDRNA2_/TRDRNA2_198414_c0_seq1.p1  ORF type:complete len:254 (+),score=45.47 gnl/TRDRNA2_/TRDRNA2_198414_c0_seq1:134-895(+)
MSAAYGGSDGRYSVHFVGHVSAEKHTEYIIKVTAPDGESWTIQKRYSEISELHDQLRLRYKESLPNMPGKRLFGNRDPNFIASRMHGLQQYFEGVLRLERDVRTPALQHFLQIRTQRGEQDQARQCQHIVEQMQNKLLNLAAPPAPLDNHEQQTRLKKYGHAMKLHVLSQPVDPVHLRAPGFDGEPLQLCSTNHERLEQLKMPSATNDGPVLNDLLDRLHEVLRTDQKICEPEKLIVPFPPISLPPGAGSGSS